MASGVLLTGIVAMLFAPYARDVLINEAGTGMSLIGWVVMLSPLGTVRQNADVRAGLRRRQKSDPGLRYGVVRHPDARRVGRESESSASASLAQAGAGESAGASDGAGAAAGAGAGAVTGDGAVGEGSTLPHAAAPRTATEANVRA